jgi:hypothetical protein
VTLAIEAPPLRRRPPRRAWRGPQYEGDFPTLGWSLFRWSDDVGFPSPADERTPLTFTDEQARQILWWYRLDPETGEFVFRRYVEEEAKGWGKSPYAGFLSLAEFAGPVCFDGWDANGEPVGVPWGAGSRPSPWVQIAAVSEDQTDNTYDAMYAMLTSNEHRVAKNLRVDDGRTRLYLTDRPGKLEPVTASAGSREGQRVTFGLLDETHLWTPRNGGRKLARTIRRNAAKMGGRTMETTNAPLLGEKSVAETSATDDVELGDVLFYARRPSVTPESDWPPEKMRAALAEVYGDAYWAPLDRFVKEIADPETGWEDALRFFFNVRTSGAGRAVDARRWDYLAQPREVPYGTPIGLGFDGSIRWDATVLRGCTLDGYSFLIGKWERPPGVATWRVDRQQVDQALSEAFARYDVRLMLADPPHWWTEVDLWSERFGKERVGAFDTNQPRRMAPAVDRWLTAIREGTHTHDGDEFTASHVKAAHLKKVRVDDDEDDGRTKYLLVRGEEGYGYDAAIADVLAYEAAMSAPEPPNRTPARFMSF